METMECHIGKMKAELRQWEARLDELVAKGGVETAWSELATAFTRLAN